MAEQILFGFPSKGRLQKDARAALRRGGLSLLEEKGRAYLTKIAECPEMDVILMPAHEIALALAQDDIHIGITGRDILRENFPQRRFRETSLPFGGCELVVAVPEIWMDVSSLDELMDAASLFRKNHARRMRAATKYPSLARNFFSKRGFADYRLVESVGATEATLTRGSAEMIVDITSSGQTLKANHLKRLSDGTILKSAAILAAPQGRGWSDETRRLARRLERLLLQALRPNHSDRSAK